nr:NADH dehydrogenase subunit 2 [Lophuromys menageshae]
MNPTTLTSIYLTLLSGPLITMLSSNLLLMWVGLEMGLLAIIPLLMNQKNPRSYEAATKYFITQATASMLLLLAISTNYMQLGVWQFQTQTNNLLIYMTFISLIIKLGLAPFHSWLPEVTQGTSLQTGLILLTWQKLAPLSILYQIHNLLNTNLTTLIAILSIFIGAWGGLNQTQTRKIMAYSSIAHMGWMMIIMPYNPQFTLLNLIIYISLTIPMFLMLMSFSYTSINSMSLSWNKNPMMLPLVSIILLSLGGLPPLTGFLPKWAITMELLKNNSTFSATMIALMALLNLFFYMRLIYSTSLTIFPTNNNLKLITQHTKTQNNPLLAPLIIMSSLTLPLTPLMTL